MKVVDRVIRRLNLRGVGVGDFEWGEELYIDEIKPNWLALGPLVMVKSFNRSASITDMRDVWNSPQAVVWRRINSNLFVIQFNCLGGTCRCIKGHAIYLVLH